MTNPDNIVRVRARNGGRASVYEANGWAQAYSSGLVEGNGVIQNTSADMNVLVGGSAAKPDVVLAENPAGYKIALDLVGQQAVAITAPASNSRISAVVAYTDDLSLATTEDTVTGSPASCGLIVVNGTASASPSAPTDNQIRTAITADGATGSQAAYCVIATIEVASNTTIITDSLITMNVAQIGLHTIDSSTLTAGLEANIDSTTSQQVLKMTTLISSVGSRLSISNNGIKIGAGVKKVLLSASVYYINSGQQRGWYKIQKNGTDTGINCIADTMPNGYGTASLSPILLDVTEDDVFTIVNIGASCKINASPYTFMTVQVVG